MKLAANLSMMFQELPFLERFAAAAQAGFSGIEYLFPYEWAQDDLKTALKDADLTQALFNTPPGDWDAGERGLASIPGRESQFRDGIDRALDYARALGCSRIHAMAGIPPDDTPKADWRRLMVDNIRHACDAAAPHGVSVLIEPINQRDMPGFAVSLQEDGADLIAEVGRPNAALQFDIYHCQIMQGDIIRRFERLRPVIGHVQIAGVPERHEPDQGEINPNGILQAMAAAGYEGWVGCEYRPAGVTRDGLGWASAYLTPKA